MEEVMERMMARKMKVRPDQMEKDCKQKQTASIERMMQLERSACERVVAVQEIIQEAESMLTQLTTTLTKVIDRIEEANASIQEIDRATTVIADFTDAAEASRIESIKTTESSKAETRQDAKAMKLGVKKLQQKLTNTKDQLMIQIQSTTPTTTHVEGTRRAIQNKYHKEIAEVRAEKDRNMATLNDKAQSI
jgi:thiol:disulfide interchange protein